MNYKIIGGGNAGRPVARLLNYLGHHVEITDPKKLEDFHPDFKARLIEMEKEGVILDLGNNEPEFNNIDFVYMAPTLPKTSYAYKKVQELNINILTNEKVSELLNEVITLDVIGITGTMGKTTTTYLTTNIFEAAGYKVWSCSSLNQNLVSEVIVDGVVNGKNEECNICVFELPHGTAGLFPNIHIDIGIFTNIHEEHLSEFGGSMEKYIERKMFIVKNSKTLIASNHLKELINQYSSRTDTYYYGWDNPEWDVSFCNFIGYGSKDNITIKYNALNLKNNPSSISGEFRGPFHMKSYFYENATAAAAAALSYGLDEKPIIEALSKFRGLDVHMEYIGKYNGREVVIDAAYLYEGLKLTMDYFTDDDVILLVDNFDTTTERDKEGIGRLCGQHAKVIVATGFNEVTQSIDMEAAQKLIDGAKDTNALGVVAGTMEEGSKLCIKHSKPGDIILHIGPLIIHDRKRILSSIKDGLKKGCLEYEGKFEYEE